MEIADFHGGDDHFEGFFAGGANGGAEELDIVEHFDVIGSWPISFSETISMQRCLPYNRAT
jgi:hypothetical protein